MASVNAERDPLVYPVDANDTPRVVRQDVDDNLAEDHVNEEQQPPVQIPGIAQNL